MRDDAYTAITNAAAAAGATIVGHERSTTVVDYKGLQIVIESKPFAAAPGWAIRIGGIDDGVKKTPSGALKHAIKLIDSRLRFAEAIWDGISKAVDIVRAHQQSTEGGDEAVRVGDQVIAQFRVEAEDISDDDNSDDEYSEVEESPQSIHDIATLRDAIRDGVECRTVHFMHSVDTLREFYCVGDEISDDEIEQVHRDELRSEYNPVLLLTLGGTVFVQPSAEYCGRHEDPIAEAEKFLTDIGGESVKLELVPNRQRREGDFVAVAMPYGTYHADDRDLVERFGVEVGTYRQVERDLEAA